MPSSRRSRFHRPGPRFGQTDVERWIDRPPPPRPGRRRDGTVPRSTAVLFSDPLRDARRAASSPRRATRLAPGGRPTSCWSRSRCVVIGLITLVAPGPGQLDRTTQQFLTSLPGLFGWFWETAYDVLFVWAVVLIADPDRRPQAHADARRRAPRRRPDLPVRGRRCRRSPGSPGADGLRGIAASAPPARYPAMRLAVAAAVVVAASPHVSRPLRRIGRVRAGRRRVGELRARGRALPSGVVAGFAVGIGAAALTHLVLGSPGGRLSLDQVRVALADLGVTAPDLRYAPLSPSGVAIVLGRDRRRPIDPREGLRARRLGRAADHVAVVLGVEPRRDAARRRPPPAGRA